MTRFFPLFLVLFCNACTPVVATRGNIVATNDLQSLHQGVSTQEEVRQVLGTPTTVDPFDANRWFYVGEVTETVAFYDPEVKKRQVVAVQFNENGILQGASMIDESSGKEVELVEKTTPAPGREMNALEQFVSNIGKFNAAGSAPRAQGQ